MSNTKQRSLAREYRPKRFTGLDGIHAQEHVTEVLKDHVSSGRVANAYLFTGTRGVGKTTAARVLAMALNCESRNEAEPCGECDSCQRILDGKTTMDVYELDAATNRGVDDARDLRERAMYAPSEPGRFKVYIIDEAHMLTRESWNAMLKILEEPPAGVVFVFATTEPQKIQSVAPPILSRCQRFDFKAIQANDIFEQLQRIAEAEGMKVTEEALHMIARRGRGSMRDALTALDQVSSFHYVRGEQITAETIKNVFNVPDETLILATLDILAKAGVEGSSKTRMRVFRGVDYCTDHALDHVDFLGAIKAALQDLYKLKAGLKPRGWSDRGLQELTTLKDKLDFEEIQASMNCAQEAARLMREPGPSEDPDQVLALFLLNSIQAIEQIRAKRAESSEAA